jgi:hypothetical protein
MLKLLKIGLLLSLLLSTVFVCAQVAPPRIFFSDMESGPNSGGQNNNGVWVTIWGKGFAPRKGQGRSRSAGAQLPAILSGLTARSFFSLEPPRKPAALL